MLLNIWDACSAALAQHYGAKALATSSASLAWANGYADGGALPRPVLLDAVARILRVSRVPLSVDIENGYSQSPNDVAELVAELASLGVAGINIEDGDHPAKLLVDKIRAIRERLGAQTPFINARTDLYLTQLVGDDVRYQELLDRAIAYQTAGADGLFVPGAISCEAAARLASSTPLPVNVMMSADRFVLQDWHQAGVKRVSFGPSPFIDAYSRLATLTVTSSEVIAKLGQFADENVKQERLRLKTSTANVDYAMLNAMFETSLGGA